MSSMERNYLSTFRTKNKSFKYEQGHTTSDRKLLPLDRFDFFIETAWFLSDSLFVINILISREELERYVNSDIISSRVLNVDETVFQTLTDSVRLHFEIQV